MKGGTEQVRRHKLHGPGEDEQAHQHGIEEGKALAAHEKAIGHAQEKKGHADGQSIGQGGPKGFGFQGTSLLSLLRSPRGLGIMETKMNNRSEK